jgi:prepilin peptidase CpaA
VPNALTFGAAVLGFLFAGVAEGGHGLGQSLVGWLIGLALFLPLFVVGGLGAGDVKLLAAFGAWLGPGGVLWAALWGSLAGGGMALVVGLAHGYLLEAFRNLGVIVTTWRVVGLTSIPGVTLQDARGPRIAYAVPLSVGALIALWLR